MELANLAGMFPDRLVAGLGHGVQEWIGQAGARVSSPLTLLEEYVFAVRRLLAGERVSVEGRYVRLDEVALDWPPTAVPPLMLGGKGPKSLAQAARLGDGVLLGAALSDDEIRETCELITRHRPQPGHPIQVPLIAATGPGAQARVDAEVPRWSKPADLGIGAAGDAAAIAEVVRRLAGFGVTSVTIQPTEDEPDLEGFVDFLGREVRPLVR
jgi:alkanesulfonate monooxygenase SsuD/methylene tetrahydromethanopterin reductase-like flavin-dependent oxidoreductase (luciferase family)